MKSFILSVSMIAVSILISVSIVACGSLAIQKWTGKIYSYQVNDLAFERKQDGEIIPHNDPKANGMFCMTEKDFLDFINVYVVTPPAKSPKASGS